MESKNTLRRDGVGDCYLRFGRSFVYDLFCETFDDGVSSALSRTEKYCEKLGDILGFKEFIVVTEEDKIKFMLEQDPTLYFKVLPYAQVLGVTDEWTDKFKNILIPEPAWCVGCAPDLFDYLILRHSIRVLTRGMMVRPQPKQGSFTGRSGGGGHFGGFGGGGHGGGGGGWR